VLRKLLGRYRISNGSSFRLKDTDPADTGTLDPDDKAGGEALLAKGVSALSDLQERLYAQDQWAVLVIFQAMDAAGKDSAIKHVMSGVNPQGVQVHAFKAPSNEDLDHDYLWRCAVRLPERGHIGIFNRSHYEEVLVVRVHRELLERQKLPPRLVTKDIWRERCQDIRRFERYLTRNGIIVIKFFLHVSKQEQKKRFLERLDRAEKHWKFSDADVHERAYWNDYMKAYEDAIRWTATRHAPWYVVPADHKWFTRIVVSAAIVDVLEGLDLTFPAMSAARRRALATARRQLERE
jgi:PPK2 family polyphosphate:nucleotide phosphotransferase